MGSKKNKWTQVGNFLVGEEKNRNGEWIVCKAVSGIWSIRWRIDSMMYGTMSGLSKEKKAHEYLHALITLMYVASNYPHDLVSLSTRNAMPVIEGFSRLLGEQTDYELSLKPPVPRDEDDEILAGERKMIELEEELKSLTESESEEAGDDVQQ